MWREDRAGLEMRAVVGVAPDGRRRLPLGIVFCCFRETDERGGETDIPVQKGLGVGVLKKVHAGPLMEGLEEGAEEQERPVVIAGNLVPGSVPGSIVQHEADLPAGVLDPVLGQRLIGEVESDQRRAEKTVGPAVAGGKSLRKLKHAVRAWCLRGGESGRIGTNLELGEFHGVLLELLLLLLGQETKRGNGVVLIEEFVCATFLPERVFAQAAENVAGRGDELSCHSLFFRFVAIEERVQGRIHFSTLLIVTFRHCLIPSLHLRDVGGIHEQAGALCDGLYGEVVEFGGVCPVWC